MTEAFWSMLQSQASHGRHWLEIAYLICLFLVLIYKPERIQSLFMFRGACLVFVLALLVPILVDLVITAASSADGAGKPKANYGNSGVYNPEGSSMRKSSAPPGAGFLVQLIFMGLNTIGPILFVVSLYLAFHALIPTRNPYAQTQMFRPGYPPPPHPPSAAPLTTIAHAGSSSDAPIFDSEGQS